MAGIQKSEFRVLLFILSFQFVNQSLNSVYLYQIYFMSGLRWIVYASGKKNKQPSKYGLVPQPIIHQTNPKTYQFNLSPSRAPTKIENNRNPSRSVPFYIQTHISNANQVYQSFKGNYYRDYQRQPSNFIRPRSNSIGLLLPQQIAEITTQRKDYIVYSSPRSRSKSQTYKNHSNEVLHQKRGKKTIIGYLGTMSPKNFSRLCLKIDKQGDSKIGACCWASSINISK